MRKLWKVSVWVLTLMLLAAPVYGGEPSTVQLTILHINDLHGHLLPHMDKSISETRLVGGAARMARMVADERSKNPDGSLLLAAGDMFQGTPISNVFRGQSVIAVMNYLKFDAMAIGNHEFDWGLNILEQLAGGAAFPFLSANIQDRLGRGLPLVKPHISLTRKNLKIAVIGVTTPDTAFITKPDVVSGLTFLGPLQVLPQLIRAAREDGTDLIVLLSHLGLDADRETAESVSGIDVIVGGHSHTALPNPLRVKETVIVQAGAYGAYLGVLQLKIDSSTHKIVDTTLENELKTVFADPGDPVDENVAGIVNGFNDQIRSEFARVVGESAVDLTRFQYDESNVGDLICDALREASRADIAFQNGGGIRTDIPKGKITLEQVYTLLPFDNVLVVMDLTGNQIRQILEQNANFEHPILQISGMNVKYDMTRSIGSRITDVNVAGRALEPGKTYRVATNDFLAAGGDQFSTFKDGENIVYGDSLREVFTAFLTGHSPVLPEVQKRIVFVNR
jgi:5'-nucleotidase / UDP-sugar diphosphatase